LAIVWVVGHREEADSLLEAAGLSDLLVEVPDNGDIKRGGRGLDPIQADLVAVPWVDGLDLIAEVVYQAHHSLEAPAFATHALP
jgi:hypothetical protein